MSKFRLAIGAVKDRTSISIAKVSKTKTNKSKLEVLILKATRHDETPIDERYVNAVLTLVSSNKAQAASCAQAIGKRIGKTRNWMVALKCLVLVLRIFQDGDPYFPREVLHSMKHGAKIVNLASFRDEDLNSWDFTAYVRTFSLYLEDRLDSFLTGKLQKNFSDKKRENRVKNRRNRSVTDTEMSFLDKQKMYRPGMLLDRISSWQKLLDRVIATRPTGAAKTNKLVLVSLYLIVQESFDLYRDISDGLALLLDGFFHLHYQQCASAFQTCVKASKQFDELTSFYDLCKSIGVGRTSEFPSIQKLSEELIETLQEFLKDQDNFPTNGRSPSLSARSSQERTLNPGKDAASDQLSEAAEKVSVVESDQCSSQNISLEDTMSTSDLGMSPLTSTEQDLDHYERRSQPDEIISYIDTGSQWSLPVERGALSASSSEIDLVFLDGWLQEQGQIQEEQQSSSLDPFTGLSDSENTFAAFGSFTDNNLSSQETTANDLFAQASTPEQQFNPFITDSTQEQAALPVDDWFPVAPTFQASPAYSVENPERVTTQQNEEDPFGPCTSNTEKENVIREQQLWLQNQDKIIRKNSS